jgi:putative spermidine/putrescine transport system permease protein
MVSDLRQGLGLARIPFIVLGVLLAIFMIVPLIIVVPTSWTAGQLLEFPPKGFSLHWYSEVFADNTWTDPFKVSLVIALEGAIISTIVGTFAALGMRRLTSGRTGPLINSLFILPLAIPYVAYALGLYDTFLHLPQAWANSTMPLVLGEAAISFPFVYVVVAGALANVDPRLASAASTLGARWPRIIWRIELPLVRTAILGGFVFAFALIFDEATLAIFLSPVTKVTLAQQLYREASESIAPTLSAVSTMVTLLAILVLGIGGLIMRGASSRAGRTT